MSCSKVEYQSYFLESGVDTPANNWSITQIKSKPYAVKFIQIKNFFTRKVFINVVRALMALTSFFKHFTKWHSFWPKGKHSEKYKKKTWKWLYISWTIWKNYDEGTIWKTNKRAMDLSFCYKQIVKLMPCSVFLLVDMATRVENSCQEHSCQVLTTLA